MRACLRVGGLLFIAIVKTGIFHRLFPGYAYKVFDENIAFALR